MQLAGKWNHIYNETGRFSGLAESDNDVIAEIIRIFVVHVDDENGNSRGGGTVIQAGIAKLNGFFHNSLLHFLADILRTVQRFGYGCLGNAKLLRNIIQCCQRITPCKRFENFVHYSTLVLKKQRIFIATVPVFSHNFEEQMRIVDTHKNKEVKL